MTDAAWRSLYVSFACKHASLICTSLSRPNAVHLSGVHCTLKVFFLHAFCVLHVFAAFRLVKFAFQSRSWPVELYKLSASRGNWCVLSVFSSLARIAPYACMGKGIGKRHITLVERLKPQPLLQRRWAHLVNTVIFVTEIQLRHANIVNVF